MGELEQLKKEYWKVLNYTRKSGRIARSVKDRVEEQWGKYDEDVIMEALRIHMSRYPGYKETYTIGIMRNIQKRKDAGGGSKPKSGFNKFEQNEYDFEQLEKEILAN